MHNNQRDDNLPGTRKQEKIRCGYSACTYEYPYCIMQRQRRGGKSNETLHALPLSLRRERRGPKERKRDKVTTSTGTYVVLSIESGKKDIVSWDLDRMIHYVERYRYSSTTSSSLLLCSYTIFNYFYFIYVA